MTLLLCVLLPFAFFIGVTELTDFIVYGSFTKKADDENILSLLKAPSTFASNKIVHFGMFKFVAKKWGVTSRWYVCIGGEQKRISIFSKMNKVIDAMHNQLLYETNKQ